MTRASDHKTFRANPPNKRRGRSLPVHRRPVSDSNENSDSSRSDFVVAKDLKGEVGASKENYYGQEKKKFQEMNVEGPTDEIPNEAEDSSDKSAVPVAPTNIKYPIICPGNSRPIVDISFSPKTSHGVFIVCGCHDRCPILRWGDNGDWIGTFGFHEGAVWSARFNSDASRVATGSADFYARTFDALNGSLLHQLKHEHIVKSVDFSRCDSKLLTGGKESILRVFDLNSLEPFCIGMVKTSAPVIKARWFYVTSEHAVEGNEEDKEERVICICEDYTIQVWDMSSFSGTLLSEWKLEEEVTDLEICAPQKTVVFAIGKTVMLHDLSASLKLRKKLEVGFNVGCVALNPATGKDLVVAGKEMISMHLIDVESGKEITTHRGHHGAIHCVAYHPDGEICASGSDDSSIRMWKNPVSP